MKFCKNMKNDKPKKEISILTQNKNFCHPTTSAFGICRNATSPIYPISNSKQTQLESRYLVCVRT